jgi:hypothetical protein
VLRGFFRRSRTLQEVRAALYESSNIFSDYMLIESDPQAKEKFRSELGIYSKRSDCRVASMCSNSASRQEGTIPTLEVELGKYWSTIGYVFALGE